MNRFDRRTFAGEGGGTGGGAPNPAPGAPAAPGAAPPAPGAPPAPAANGAADLAWLPEGYRANPVFARMKSVDDLAKEHAGVQSLIGGDKVPLPGKDAKPEDWDRFYNRLGRPETADKYELGDFKPPAGLPWNEAVQKSMLGEMHKAGLNSKQVSQLLSAYAASQGTEWANHTAAMKQQFDAAEASLRTEWGRAYDERVKIADSTWRWLLGGDEAAKRVAQLTTADGTPIGAIPEIVRVFHNVAQMLGTERKDLPPGMRPPSFGVLTPESAKAELNAMMGDKAKVAVLQNRMHPEYAALNARRLQLLETANPQDTMVRRDDL